MAFENSIASVYNYNRSQESTLVKAKHLRFVIESLAAEISTSSSEGDYLPLLGGEMAGEIDMGGFAITGVDNIQLSSGGSIADGNLENFTFWSTNNGDIYIDLSSQEIYHSASLPFNYAGDYSANYTDRSLVDKAYVDEAIAAAIAALPLP